MKCRRNDAIDAPLLNWSDSTASNSSDDDNDGANNTAFFSYSLQQRRHMHHQLLRADVHRCRSLVCPACSSSHEPPTFISTPMVDPASIRHLPPRWWDTATVAAERDCFNCASAEWTETFNDVCQFNESTPRVTGPVVQPSILSERTFGSIVVVTSPKESSSTDNTELTNLTVAWATKTCLMALDGEDSD